VPTALPADLTIRQLASTADYDACVSLQRATWGDDFRELVPPALLLVGQKIGGVVAGAFAREDLVGFVFGLTGLRDGRPVHWSHMLAVAETWRDRGIGRALKAFQRDHLVASGVERMYWTYDPLVARNAHLNLRTLGARVIEYARDLYGTNPMSHTDRVIGSDRFVVAWDLRVPEPPPDAGNPPLGPLGGEVIASEEDPLPDIPAVLVAIPADIHLLKDADAAGAARWRRATRRAFEHYLARGYTVSDVQPHPHGDGSCYRLERKS